MHSLLPTDLYVPHYDSGAEQIHAITSYLNDALDLELTPGDLDGAILVLASYTTYLTYESFYLLFPTASSRVTTSMRRLLKSGYLRKGSFDLFEGTAKNYYSITAAGYHMANSLSRRTIPKYKYGRKNTSIAHTYAIGLNFLAILSLGLPVAFDKEVMYNRTINALRGSRRGELQIDGVAYIHPTKKEPRVLYIEQDMGYENDSVLYEKIVRYQKYGILSEPNNAIIFSYRLKAIQATAPSGSKRISPYSLTMIRKLLHVMEQEGYMDASELLSIKEKLPENLSSFLPVFLSSCDAIRIQEDTYKKGRVLADTAFLKEYASSLSTRTNPYVLREINRQQDRLKERRLMKFISLFLEAFEKGDCYPIILDFLAGYPLYMVNTNLLCNDLRLILPKESGFIHVLAASLSGLYQTVSEYQMFSPVFSLPKAGNIRFRNCFETTQDGTRCHVCFCFASIDLSAWIRSFCLLQEIHHSSAGIQIPPIHLIMVFDTHEQVKFFYQQYNAYYSDTMISYDKPAVLSIMRYDLGKSGRIFTLTDPFSFSSNAKYYFPLMLF